MVHPAKTVVSCIFGVEMARHNICRVKLSALSDKMNSFGFRLGGQQ